MLENVQWEDGDKYGAVSSAISLNYVLMIISESAFQFIL